MSDSETPANVRYLAEFADGPLEGTSETRVLVDGEHDAVLTRLAAVQGTESMFRYVASDTREIAGELHVRYTFDESDSDPVQGDDEDDSQRL